MNVPQGEFPADHGPEREGSEHLRVVTDAVIGGGMDLREGQVVSREKLGDYASILLDSGAVVPIEDASSGRFDLR